MEAMVLNGIDYLQIFEESLPLDAFKKREKLYHKSIFRTWSNIPNGILSRWGCKIADPENKQT